MSDSSLGGDRAGSGQGAGTPGGDVPKGIAAAIAEVSDRATLLVREEIELAKAEVAEKASKLVRGAVVGIAAGVFLVTALFFVLIGCAWLLYYYLPIGNDFAYFWGFFAMALILLVLGLIAGLIAARAVKRGSPPVPDMAIEEARRIRDTVSAGAHEAPSAAPAASTGAPTAAPAPYGAAAPHAAVPPATDPSAGPDREGGA